MSERGVSRGPQRAVVDITVDAETMLDIRDELRRRLIRQFHLLRIASRANRKVGNLDLCRKQDEQSDRTAIMIWCLDNPMTEVTPPA